MNTHVPCQPINNRSMNMNTGWWLTLYFTNIHMLGSTFIVYCCRVLTKNAYVLRCVGSIVEQHNILLCGVCGFGCNCDEEIGTMNIKLFIRGGGFLCVICIPWTTLHRGFVCFNIINGLEYLKCSYIHISLSCA